MRKKRLHFYAILLIAWLVVPWVVNSAASLSAQVNTECPQPINLRVAVLSQNSAVIQWALGEGTVTPSSYKLVVKTASNNTIVKEDAEYVTTDNSVELTSLNPGTEYIFELISDCSKDSYKGESAQSTLRFSTLVNPCNLPIVQNFNTATAIPQGWIPTGNVSVTSSMHHGSAGNSMKIEATSASDAMIVLTQMAHAAADIQFTAYILAEYGTKYQIGLIPDVADPSSFYPLYEGEVELHNEWNEIRFNTLQYTIAPEMENMSFAILLTKGIGSNSVLYVDDVNIVKMPTCPRPEKLKAYESDSAAVSLAWEGKEGVSSHQVYLMSEADSEYRQVETNPVRINKLVEKTKYTVRVRDICAVGDTSEWSHPVEFSTSCGTTETIVQKYDFDTPGVLPECWMSFQTKRGVLDSGTDHADTAWTVSNEMIYSGSYALQLKDSPKGTRTVLVSRPVRIDAAGKYDLSFYFYRNTGEKASDEGVAVWINDRPDTVNGEKLAFLPGGYTFAPAEPREGWYKYEYNIGREGVVYVILEGRSQYSHSQYLDELSIDVAPTCRRISSSSVLYNSVSDGKGLEVSWKAAGTERKWELQYNLLSESGNRSDTVVIENTPSIRFENLTAGETYRFSGRLAAICGEKDTSEYVLLAHKVVLDCSDMIDLPFTESFETNNRLPLCWISKQIKQGTGSGGDDWGDELWHTITSPLASSGNYVMELRDSKKDTHTTLTPPPFTIPENEEWMVSLYVYRDDNQYSAAGEGIRVWVNNIPDTLNATLLLNIQHGMAFDPVVPVPGMYHYHALIPDPGTQYLIIEGISQYGAPTIIDDVSVVKVPKCMPIQSCLKIDSVAHDAIELSISETIDWEVECCVAGSAMGTGRSFSSSDSTMLITGLTSDSQYDYDIYARSVCGENKSTWTKTTISFRTRCYPFEVTESNAFVESFEDLNVGEGIDDCYTVIKESNSYDFEAVEEFTDYGNFEPYGEGSRFMINKYGSATWLFRPMTLRANVNYEMYGYFMQDDDGETTTSASLAVATNPNLESIIAKPVEGAVILDTWRRVAGYFTVPTDGVYYIGWYIAQDGSPYRHAMDNLGVREVYCVPPSSISVTDIGSDSAVISWMSNADKWEVKVSETKINPNDVVSGLAYHDTVITKYANVVGLNSGTVQYYYLRSFCDDKPSDWTEFASFRTYCDAKQLPVSETFEDEALAEFSCWTIVGEDAEYYRDTYSSHSGEASLALYNAMAVSPQIDVPTLSNCMITGWVRTDENDMSFDIGVMLNPEDGTSWKKLKTITVPVKEVWQEFIVYMSEFDDLLIDGIEPKYVSVTVAGATDVYFDDVLIDVIPSCPKPTETVISNVAHDHFTLSWHSNGSEKQWNVVVNAGDQTVLDTIVDKNPSVISGLLPSMKYDVTISAVCAPEDTSVVVSCGSFATTCVPRPIPYDLYIDFDDEGKDFPQCWTLGDGNTPYPEYNWAVKNYGEEMCLSYINYYGGENTYHMLLSPVFDLTKESEATMYATILNNAMARELYVRLSIDGGNTFTVALDTIEPMDTRQMLTYDLTEYLGSNVVIAFEAHAGTQYGSDTRIYAFGIDKAESCRRPNAVEVVETSDTEVSLLIVDDIPEHKTWQVVYGLRDFDYENTEVRELTSKTFVIDSLKPLTSYYIYVRTKCDDGSVSSWRGPLKLTTACPRTVSLPYLESFEYRRVNDMCIDVINARTDKETDYYGESYYYPDVLLNPYGTTHGDLSLQLVISDDEPLFLVLPVVNEPLNTIMMQFDYCYQSPSSTSELILGVLTDIEDIYSFVPLRIFDRGVSTYTGTEFHFNTVTDLFDENARIAIKLTADDYSSGKYVYIDNLRLSKDSPCPWISNPEILGVTSTSATIVAESLADSIQCVYGFAGINADDCKSTMTVKNDTFDIVNLEAGKAYYIHLRSLCGTDTGLWTSPLLVSPSCDMKPLAKGDSWTEKFDDVTFPSCFTPVTTTVYDNTLYPTVDTVNAVDKYGLRLKGQNIVALPQFDVDADRLMVSFCVKGNSKEIHMGMMNSLHPDSAITKVGTIRGVAKDISTVNSFDMSIVGINGKYAVLYTTTDDADITVDSIVVKWAPTFFAPRNLNVSAMDTTALVSWTAAPDAEKYVYRLMLDNAVVKEDIVPTSSFELRPIQSSTKYTLLVAAVSGSGVDADTTDYSRIVFTTLANVTNVPFMTGFENDTDNVKWQYVQENITNKWVIGADITAVKSDRKSMYISKDNGTYEYFLDESAYGQHAYRTLHLTPGYYYCSYDWKCEGEGSYDYAYVNLVPESEEIPAGDLIGDGGGVVHLYSDDRLSRQPSWKNEYTMFEISNEGNYNFVISWKNDNSTGTQPPFAIDNILLDKIDCTPLTSVTVDSVRATSAYLSVANPNDGDQIEYRLLSDNEVIAHDTIVGHVISFEDMLQLSSKYTFEVRSYCGENTPFPFVSVEFTTPCQVVDVTADTPYFEGFETYVTDRSDLSHCWNENAEWIVRKAPDTYQRVPYEGEGYLTIGQGNSGNMYTEFNLEGGKYYAISVMARQSLSTGCRLDIVRHSDNGITSLASYDVKNSWLEISTDFFAIETGTYRLGLSAELRDKAAYLSIDNFSIKEIPFARPVDFVIDSVGMDYAAFSWSGQTEKYQMQILRGDQVLQDSITDKQNIVLDGLTPNTQYTAQLRAIQAKDSSNRVYLEFNTECEVHSMPYAENFTRISNGQLPSCWDNISGSDIRKKENWKVDAGRLNLTVSKALGHAEVWSPMVNITDASTRLTFDYSNSSFYDTLYVVVSTDGGASFPDTLLRAATTLNTTSATYELGNYIRQNIVVAFGANTTNKSDNNRILIDNIRIACYGKDIEVFDSICPNYTYDANKFYIPAGELAVSGDYEYLKLIQASDDSECDHYSKLYLHVRRGGIHTIDTTICEGSVYVSDAFPTGLSKAGWYTSSILQSSEDCDSTIYLNLRIANTKLDICDTICSGETYPFAGKEYDRSGIYSDTTISSLGCDSITTLTLVVLPKYFESTKTICTDNLPYMWRVGGKDSLITAAGRYECMFLNILGCDSIVALDLTVLPDTVRIDSTICYGQKVQHGIEFYSTTGVYPITLENELSCKYTSELHLTVLAPDTISEQDHACQGKEYYGHGFQGITINNDTVLLGTSPDADGCITVTRVEIDLIPTIEMYDTVEIKSGGSYNFCGNTYTDAGTYTCLNTSTEGCDSITYLTIVVTTGIERNSVLPLTLAPNPIGVNDITYIYRTWTAEEQQGLTVEILNSVGQIISSDTPEYYPIAIPSLHVSGIYHIRVTTGTGNVYMGKLIVR